NAIGGILIEPVQLGNILNQDHKSHSNGRTGMSACPMPVDNRGRLIQPMYRLRRAPGGSGTGQLIKQYWSSANSTTDSRFSAIDDRTSLCHGVVYPVIPTKWLLLLRANPICIGSTIEPFARSRLRPPV